MVCVIHTDTLWTEGDEALAPATQDGSMSMRQVYGGGGLGGMNMKRAPVRSLDGPGVSANTGAGQSAHKGGDMEEKTLQPPERSRRRPSGPPSGGGRWRTEPPDPLL